MKTAIVPEPTESSEPKRMEEPFGWGRFVNDTKGRGSDLSDALQQASAQPARHERRNLDRLARKYGMKGMEALYYWRQENGKADA
jgi:hypothetical protein